MACVQGDHEAGEGGEGERGAPGETAFSRAGGGQEIPEAERQVHREGTKGKIFHGHLVQFLILSIWTGHSLCLYTKWGLKGGTPFLLSTKVYGLIN